MEAAQHPWPALGVLLLRDGLVTKDDLNSILDGQRDSRQQRITGGRLGEILVERGVVSTAQVARLLAEQYELPFMELAPPDVDARAAQAFSIDQAQRFSAVPINRRPDGSYDVAIADPSTVVFSDELRGILGTTLHFVVVGNDAIADAIADVFNRPDVIVDGADTSTVVALHEAETDADSFPRTGTLAQLWPPLGALLVRDGLVSDEELEAALAQQRLSTTQRLGEILVERGAVSKAIVARLVAEQYELPFAELDALEVDESVARLLPEEVARRYCAVPIGRHVDGSLEIAIADPTIVIYSDDLHTELGAPLRLVVAPPDEIDALIARTYRPDELDDAMPIVLVEPSIIVLETSDDERVAVDYVAATDDLVTDLDYATIEDEDVDAAENGDLMHSETSDQGVLPPMTTAIVDTEPHRIEEAMFDADARVELELVAAPEIVLDADPEPASTAFAPEPDDFADYAADDLAEVVRQALDRGASVLHISEHDGAVDVRVRIAGALETTGSYPADDLPSVLATLAENPDVEILSLPTTRGTKLTVSVIERPVAPITLGELGLTDHAEDALRAALAQPGLVVVTGTPGSGVTTTLYAALDVLATSERIAATVEDRLERILDGVEQTEIDDDAGLTFASGLRQHWAMDADVVLVSGIPDSDTAAAALQCALAGRHVLAGLGESDAAAAAALVLELSGDSERLAPALACIVSQRLVPRVCDDCRETYYASPSELDVLGLDPGDGHRLLARGRGCRTCSGTGSRGHTAAFEVMTVSDELRKLVRSGAAASEIRDVALAARVPTLRDEVVRLCLEGLTTTAELDRLSESLAL